MISCEKLLQMCLGAGRPKIHRAGWKAGNSDRVDAVILTQN